MKRKAKHINVLNTVSELLVDLQLNGHMEGAKLSDWATGTSVDELLAAVKYVGDGEWLDGVYPDLGAQESADHWLYQFLIGEEVPSREEAKQLRMSGGVEGDSEADQDDSLDREQLETALTEYLGSLSDSEAAQFIKRMENDDGFARIVFQNLEHLGVAFAAAAYASDGEFAKAAGDFTFLKAESTTDMDLIAMSRCFLVSNRETVLDGFGMSGNERNQAVERIDVLASRLEKAVQSAP